jgi:PAS domain S-box-containing protein
MPRSPRSSISTPVKTPEDPRNSDLYALLVSSIRDYAIFALDPKGYVQSWNAGAQSIKGYLPEEIIGKHFSTFYSAEEVAAGKPDFELAEAARVGRFEDEGWRVRKDGTRFWANVVITALRGLDGELRGFGKVTRDLTERRRQAEALRRSEERFRLLIQGVRDYGIFMLDPQGRVVSWNAGAQRISGYTAEDIVGRHFSTFYPEEDNLRGKPAWELEMALQEGSFEDEGWRLRKDGARFWANVIITPIRRPGGQLLGFAKVTRDLTERRETEALALAAARRVAEVEAASRAKSEFLATLSHELRTPLNAIGGYAELLTMEVRGPLADGQREYIERIRRSQQHLLSIINDLLNYSRVEAGGFAYEAGPVSISEVIDSVVAMVEPQTMNRGIDLRADPPSGEVTAWADRLKTEQILLNLLSNASKFTPAGGSIVVSCETDGERINLRVVDSGVGIPADKLDEVFEPFVQLGRTLITGHEGTGLGLAISRDLARGMGGDLTAESEPGKGSTFTLSLPVADPGKRYGAG